MDAANLIAVIIQEPEWGKSGQHCRVNLFTPLALKCGEDTAIISTDVSANSKGCTTMEAPITTSSKTIHPEELAFSLSGAVERNRIRDRLLPLRIYLKLTTRMCTPHLIKSRYFRKSIFNRRESLEAPPWTMRERHVTRDPND